MYTLINDQLVDLVAISYLLCLFGTRTSHSKNIKFIIYNNASLLVPYKGIEIENDTDS